MVSTEETQLWFDDTLNNPMNQGTERKPLFTIMGHNLKNELILNLLPCLTSNRFKASVMNKYISAKIKTPKESLKGGIRPKTFDENMPLELFD